jgi:hypothetical protein
MARPTTDLAITMSMPSSPHCDNRPGASDPNPHQILTPTTHQSSLVIPKILRVSTPKDTARRRSHQRRAIAGKESYTNTERRRVRSVGYRGAGRVGAARDSATDSAHAPQGIRHRAPTSLHNTLLDAVGERNRGGGRLARYTTVEACSEKITPARTPFCCPHRPLRTLSLPLFPGSRCACG